MSDPANDLYLRACRGEAVERLPVWIMRQAGRYLPEYRRVRERADFLTLCKTPELAAEVTVQPVDILGVDAAILFADILLPLEAMGAGLRFEEGEGPKIERPVRRAAQVDDLRRPDVGRDLGYVFEAVRHVRRALAGRVPLIGFAGAPWTLAAYLVEGGGSKSFGHLLGWSYRDPEGLSRLLDLLAEVTIDYLEGQIEAGAQAVQLFDTWAGLLDRRRYDRLARPPLERVLDAVGGRVPRAVYARGGGHLLESLAGLPLEVLSVDWRLPLGEVRRRVGPGPVLQGNLDPAALLGPRDSIRDAVARVIEDGRGGGHVINLGHGILPITPVENARAMVEAVHELSARSVRV